MIAPTADPPVASTSPPAGRPPAQRSLGGPSGPAGFWQHYRPVLASRDFVCAALTGLLTLASWGLEAGGAPRELVVALAAAGALAGGLPIAWGALRGLWHRELNVDELVAIAIAASMVAGEYQGAALVAFMMLFGKVLEDVTAARAERAIEGLGQLVPALARVRDPEAPGGERTVPVACLETGDIVVVRPGERLPVDGVVLAGRAAVEEAAITGEPLPAEKTAGDEVFAGTLATGGALEIRATRTGHATALGRIAALVQEAEAERAPIVRAADRWARWFTPAVLALAVAVYVARGEFLPAVTVLVVACPCALVLATPTAVVAGIARGARRGILVKGGARLEAAGHVDAVCLDKTGTLTRGRPAVQRIAVFSAATLSEADLLAYAAAAEQLSEHPLARAVLDAALAQGLPVATVAATHFEALPGRGVAARLPRPRRPAGPSLAELETRNAKRETQHVQVLVGGPEFLEERGVSWPLDGEAALAELAAAGQTPLAVALDGRAVGLIGVADEVRPEAAAAIRDLRAAGVGKVVLLTGDREGPAQAIARAVGIASDDVHAGLLPEAKVAQVRALRAAGYRVAMVGDGVNDAPALAAADVAIAMGAAGTGTDLAMAAADVVLMTEDVRQAAAAIVLSRQTLGIIRQNLVFAAAWNVLAVIVASLGGFGPVGGALIHNVGSVAVVANAARLVNARLQLSGAGARRVFARPLVPR